MLGETRISLSWKDGRVVEPVAITGILEPSPIVMLEEKCGGEEETLARLPEEPRREAWARCP